MRHILKFLRGAEGATAIEYALIASLIAVALITILGGLGSQIAAVFTEVSGAVK